MPLAPLPANNTDRWFLDYITGSASTAAEHTMALRLPVTAGVDGASGAFYHILASVGASGFWVGWRPIRMRYQAAGSDFSVPAGMGSTLSAFVGTGSSTGYLASYEALELTLQGRSYTSGRRVDFSLYGVRLASGIGNFRYTASAGAPFSTLINAVQTWPLAPLTIDGSTPTWYSYVNANYNSYWEQQQRTA